MGFLRSLKSPNKYYLPLGNSASFLQDYCEIKWDSKCRALGRASALPKELGKCYFSSWHLPCFMTSFYRLVSLKCFTFINFCELYIHWITLCLTTLCYRVLLSPFCRWGNWGMKILKMVLCPDHTVSGGGFREPSSLAVEFVPCILVLWGEVLSATTEVCINKVLRRFHEWGFSGV